MSSIDTLTGAPANAGAETGAGAGFSVGGGSIVSITSFFRPREILGLGDDGMRGRGGGGVISSGSGVDTSRISESISAIDSDRRSCRSTLF